MIKKFISNKNILIYLSVIVTVLAIIILFIIFQDVSEPVVNVRTFDILSNLKNSIQNPFNNNTFLSNKIPRKSKVYNVEPISQFNMLDYVKTKYSLSEEELKSGYLSKLINNDLVLNISDDTLNFSYTKINNSTSINLNSIQIAIINYLHALGNDTNYDYLKKIELSNLYFRFTYMSMKDEAILAPKTDANTVFIELFPILVSEEDKIIISNNFEPIISFLSNGSGDILSVSTKNILLEYRIQDYVNITNNFIESNIFKFNYVYDLNSDYGMTSTAKYNITPADLSSIDTIYLLNSNNEAIPFVVGTFVDNSGLEYRFGFDIIQGLR